MPTKEDYAKPTHYRMESGRSQCNIERVSTKTTPLLSDDWRKVDCVMCKTIRWSKVKRVQRRGIPTIHPGRRE